MKDNYKILIVDDSTTHLKLTSEILLFNGYNIIKTTSGKQAIILAVEHVPDLIILDIIMPYIDGHTVLEEIKKFDFLKNKPVVMLSSKKDLEDIKRSKDAGIIDYIVKPISVSDFVDRIRRIVPLETYENMGSYVNGDNFIDEQDINDDLSEVKEKCKQILKKKESLGRVGDVMKKDIKQETKITVIDGYPVRLIKKALLKPGMVPAVDIQTKSGMVVHPAGLELNEKIINKMQEIDIEESKLFIRG